MARVRAGAVVRARRLPGSPAPACGKRFAHRLAHAPGTVRGLRHTGRAAAADDVSDAARQREQLARQRGGRAPVGVEATRPAPARIRAAGQRAQAGVAADAPVLDARGRDIAGGRSAGAPVALLPLLLVATLLERDIERPHPQQRATPDGHVRPPRKACVLIGGAQVK